MIIAILLNAIVFASAFLIVFRLLKEPSQLDSIISVFIIYISEIILFELGLGMVSKLTLMNLALVSMGVFIFIYFFSLKITSSFDFKEIQLEFSGILRNKIVLLALAFMLGFGIIKVGINLFNPPFGWDSLNYHFSFPVEWLKSGNLNVPIVPFDDPAPTYYPLNGSLFYLWLIFPLKNVLLADLGQLPFFLLAFLAVFSIARKLEIDTELSFLAAAVFILIPNLFKQLSIAYVDVMVAGLLLVGVNYLFILREKFSFKNILLFSATFGLLIGTKTIALAYSILLLVPFLYFCFKNLKKSYFLVIFIILVIAFGGFSYIRNYLETGNPLYPVDIKIFGKAIFSGVIDRAVYGAHFRPEDYSLAKLLFREGLGVQILLFVIPGLFLGLPVYLFKKRKAAEVYLAYFLLLPILMYLIYRYVIPLANARYIYALFGIGIVSGIYFWKMLKVPRIIIGLACGVCVLSSAGQLAKRQELVAGIILSLLLFFFLLAGVKFFSRLSKRIFIIILFIAVIILFIAENNYIANEYPRYLKMAKYSGFWPEACQAWDWLNTNTKGNNIAYTGRPVPFPLYGSGLKNNVYYVSVNKVDPAKLHYFINSRYVWGYDFLSQHKSFEEKNNYRAQADYKIWLKNLLARNTDYLFVYSLHQTKEIIFPMEDEWAKLNPQIFVLVYSNSIVHIYKIERGKA